MRFSIGALLCLAAGVSRAQVIRGVVVDSASGQRVPGVVITLLDSNAALLGRIITNQRGQFNVPAAGAVRRIRAQRIGFRSRMQDVRVTADGFTDLEVRLATLPTMLEPVRVETNSHCPKRADNAATWALLEQTRAGVLASVVARGRDTAKMRVLVFDRSFDERERLVSQVVRYDSAVTLLPFGASRTPRDFVTGGFVRDRPGGMEFYAPDAEVLSSEDFAAAYCFRLADRDRARPNQVGLAFEPGARAKGRQAIGGVVWIDTVQRRLVDLEYRYLDLGRLATAVKPGGRVSFVEARPGVTLIDRWSLRLPRLRADTTRSPRSAADVIRTWFEPVETGAELAHARWDDGSEWSGQLGTLRVIARARDTAVAGLQFRLDSTDYQAVTDSAGFMQISELLPGPYVLTAHHPALSAVGLAYPSSLHFAAARDSIIEARLDAPTPEGYAFDRCNVARRMKADAPPHHLIVAIVVRPDGRPVDHAVIKAKRTGDANYFLVGATTGSNGRFEVCVPERMKADQLTFIVQAPSYEEKVVYLIARDPITPLKITVGEEQ